MTQDYVRRKPRKRKQNARKKSKPSLPPWLWLATGLCIGALGSLLFHLAALPRDAGAGPGEQQTGADSAAEDDVEFNFYTLLPQREVMVSTDKQPSRARPTVNPEKSSPSKQAETAYRYYLQAGSFQRREEAEKRRIQLLLLDMEANIEKVKHQGKSWYRVQAGPYHSTKQLATVRNTLSGEGIDTLVTKRKAD